MGPLSAVAVSFWLVIYGLIGTNAFTASANSNKALGIFAFIAAGLIVLDAFVINSNRWWKRRPQ